MTISKSVEHYRPIADYGLIGDMRSCALVSKDGSIDWCCLPRFDSPAVFGRILDWNKGGYFQVNLPAATSTVRRYIPNTNVLETNFVTATGSAKLIDFMPTHPQRGPVQPMEISDNHRVIRILKCAEGSVEFLVEVFPRFDYGTIVPHAVLDGPNKGFAHGGAAGLTVYCSAPMIAEDDGFRSVGTLQEGENLYAAVTYRPQFSHTVETIEPTEMEEELERTVKFWQGWSAQCTYRGEFREDVVRSALTLKALTYAPSGAVLAAATTSLPEVIGGERNWDYRFTWVRDSAFALYALAIVGYLDEAKAFRAWLEWSTSGRAQDLQLMYGLGGERRLTEIEIRNLDGYRRSRPVRVGNGAYDQFQLDIYGELMDAAHIYRKLVGDLDERGWEYLRQVVGFVLDHWRDPDEGIWETRGGRQHFVFSKVMCWVALDRAIKAAKALKFSGEVKLWEQVRAEIKEEVLQRGYDANQGVFVQHYGSKALDASNLMMPLVGFISARDPRMKATILATERELTSPQGFVYRYRDFDDGLGGHEGTFTICTFWLADNLILLGEIKRARILFDKLRACSNDLGLFSEEVDTVTGEMLGNFPQAFPHMAIISTAVNLGKHQDKSA